MSKEKEEDSMLDKQATNEKYLNKVHPRWLPYHSYGIERSKNGSQVKLEQ